MRMSPELQAQYEDCRLRMNQLTKQFRIYMWSMIFLGATVFASAFTAGALSTIREQQVGASIFYYAMSAGVFQILLGLATILFGWMTAARARIPSLILLGLYAVGIMMILFGKNGTFAAANIFFLLAGFALNLWAQRLCSEDDALKELPGYPLFSVEADTPAEYVPPLNVTVRRAEASENMDSIGISPVPGGSAAEQKPVPKAEHPREPFSVPAPLGPTPAVALPPEVGISGRVALTEMESAAAAAENATSESQPVPDLFLDSLTNQQEQQETALPQVNAAEMLVDMTAIPSHATVQGNPDLLPTPEDVRARLAAMKRARQEHYKKE